jgi:hypothetical protein
MTVIPFHRRDDVRTGWAKSEIESIAAALAPALGRGDASQWVVTATERGDPQLYLLGPEPEQECILCISRVGDRYIVEDGTGGLLSERGSLLLLAEQIRQLLNRRTAALFARIGLLWIAGRRVAEEKIEPIMAEPVEFLSEFAPLAIAA